MNLCELFELMTLYVKGKLQQKSKVYVYRNSGKFYTEFCLLAFKSLFNCYTSREVGCVVQHSSWSND